MKRALRLLVIGAGAAVLGACASGPADEPGAPTDASTPTENSTPPPDQENLRNILRERPN